MVHNGIIGNDNVLIAQNKFEMDAEVDSEVILRLIEPKWWESVENLEKLTGGYACAFIHEKRPAELILVRHNNPIAVHIDEKRDILFWASTEGILEDAISRYHRGFMLSKPKCYSLSEDKAVLIAGHGVADTKKLTTTKWGGYNSGNNDENKQYGYWSKGEWHPYKKLTQLEDHKNKKNKDTTSKWRCDMCEKVAGSLIMKDNRQYCSDCYNRFYKKDRAKESNLSASYCDSCGGWLTIPERSMGMCDKCISTLYSQ
jgi:hypothetical protein